MQDYEQTLHLIKQAKNGDETSKNTLVIENAPLIKSVIKSYKTKGMEYDDLYQLGCLGFVKAIANFDESFGVKFSTYAVPMIAGEVKRFLRDNGIIKVSRSVKAQNILISKYIDSYINEKNTEPSIQEIAEHFGISEQDVVFAMESNRMPISIMQEVGDDEGRNLFLIDKISNGYDIDIVDTKLMLVKILSSLSPRDKKIILLRYFRDKTQSEIAKEIGVSQVQISRLENKILSYIKSKMA